ncbi:MAG: hypothetical protein ACI85F_000981 [Bacteroidia bacterium]|jgi:hypothetical protein
MIGLSIQNKINMKKLFTLLFAAALTQANAQIAVVVTEGEDVLAGKVQNAMTITVYNGDADNVTKAWKKQLKDLKGKITAKEELFADDCKLEAMGANTFDLYSKTRAVEGLGCNLVTSIDLGGAYLNSTDHAEQFKVMRDLVYAFGVEQNKAVIQLEVNEHEKTLKSLQKELASLEKKDKKMDEDITKNKTEISEAEMAKVENLNARQAKSDAIIALEKINSDDDALGKLRGERKFLEKDGKKLDGSVGSGKKKTTKLEEEKAENKVERESKTAEIAAQQTVVDKTKERKEAVK